MQANQIDLIALNILAMHLGLSGQSQGKESEGKEKGGEKTKKPNTTFNLLLN